MPYAHITGWGMAVPETVMTNDDLTEFVETNDAWIRERTGIRERRIAKDTDFPSTLAVEASLKALKLAKLRSTDLDLIICSTSPPEYIFPATECLLQDQLGATKAGAFDLLAACSGFIYALNMGAQAIRSGSIKNALIIGSETLSRFINWKDRNTCILFGDGAGAFVLQASEQPGGVLSAVMHSDGSGADLLTIAGGGSRYPSNDSTVHNGKHYIQMDGKEVFRFATRVMASATQEVLACAGLTIDQVQWIVPHQANIRIIEAAARGEDGHHRVEGAEEHPQAVAAGATGVRTFPVSPPVMGHLTSTVTPQGIVAVARFVDVPLHELPTRPMLVPVLCAVRDPGNAGTVLRSADAAQKNRPTNANAYHRWNTVRNRITRAPPRGWWIMIRAFSVDDRVPVAVPRRNAAAEAASPTQRVFTLLLSSWMVS